MIIVEDGERDKAIKKFQYLWKVDSEDWLNERKESWKNLLEDYFYDSAASELKKYKTYYLSGVREEYISPTTLFLLTPLRSPEIVRDFVFSRAFNDPDRLIMEFVNVAANSKIRINLLRPHVILYSQALLGREYKVIEIKINNAIKVASPNPSSWAGSYFVHTRNFFQNRDVEYSPVVDLLDYFISSLKFADSPKHLPKKHMDTLIAIIESDHAENDPRPIAREFLQSLRSRKDEILENWNKNSHLFM